MDLMLLFFQLILYVPKFLNNLQYLLLKVINIMYKILLQHII